MNKFWSLSAILLLLSIISCKHEDLSHPKPKDVYKSAQPYTRWWWFSSEIKKQDIRAQLKWVKKKQFGGVEIAFIYPVNRNPNAERTKWLSDEWTEAVSYAKHCADSLGLGCDFTFGTLWPFGGTFVPDSDRTKVYGDTSFHQHLRLAWTHPDTGNVLNHMDKGAFQRYADTMGEALQPALKGGSSALFCDSWEVETRKIWTDDFKKTFHKRYGYDITKYMDSIYSQKYSDERYDYMQLVADMVLNRFYKPFTSKSHELGAISRVQCAGSPTDIIQAYAHVDVPETEAMLYEPNYSKIVASAAALTGKNIVSSETFTCLYGWPDDYHLKAQIADLKLVADALFANGVNQIIWHGMPYNPVGVDTNYFYATVHVGKRGNLSDDLSSFNNYMTKVSEIMRKGRTYSNVAMYLPLEDAWYAGEYPKEKQMKWSWGAYELRYKYVPKELEGYHPLWINRHFIKHGTVRNGKLHCGNARFSALYVNAKYLDIKTLEAIEDKARKGLPVCLKQLPKEAGKNKHQEFKNRLKALYSLDNVSKEFINVQSKLPLMEGENIPAYWARMTEKNLYLFLAHPKAEKLKYPLDYGESYTEDTSSLPLTIHYNGHDINHNVQFKPYQSVIIKINEKGNVKDLNISYRPETPTLDTID